MSRRVPCPSCTVPLELLNDEPAVVHRCPSCGTDFQVESRPIRRQRKHSGDHRSRGVPGWIWGLAAGGAVLLLLLLIGAIAVILVARSSAEKKRMESAYNRLRDRMSPQQVEAILGPADIKHESQFLGVQLREDEAMTIRVWEWTDGRSYHITVTFFKDGLMQKSWEDGGESRIGSGWSPTRGGGARPDWREENRMRDRERREREAMDRSRRR